MTTINKTWTNNLLSNSSPGSQIDDQVNFLAAAYQERAQNGGHYIPNSNAVTSGIHACSTSNYGASATTAEFVIYGSDLATKKLRVKDASITSNVDLTVNGNLTVTGSLSVNGQSPVGTTYHFWGPLTFATPSTAAWAATLTQEYWPHDRTGTVRRLAAFTQSGTALKTGQSITVTVSKKKSFGTGATSTIGTVTLSAGSSKATTTAVSAATFDTSGNLIIVSYSASMSGTTNVSDTLVCAVTVS